MRHKWTESGSFLLAESVSRWWILELRYHSPSNLLLTSPSPYPAPQATVINLFCHQSRLLLLINHTFIKYIPSKFISPIVLGIDTRLWNGQSRVRFPVLAVGDLFFLQNLQTASGAQQVFYSTAIRTSLCRVMRSVGDGDHSRQSSDEGKSGLSHTAALLVPSWCAWEQL